MEYLLAVALLGVIGVVSGLVRIISVSLTSSRPKPARRWAAARPPTHCGQ